MSLASAPLLVRAAHAQPVASEPTAGPVVVQVGPDDPHLAALGEAIRAHLMEVDNDPFFDPLRAEPVRVVIALAWLDESRTSYALAMQVALDGRELWRTDVACKLCGTAELLDAATGMLRSARRVVVEQRLREQEQANEPVQPPPDAPPPAEPERSRGLSPMGWAGIGLAAGGVAAATTGGVLLAMKERPVANTESSGSQSIEYINFRPPGIALLASGGALLAGGMVLTFLGLRQQPERELAVAPFAGPGTSGLTVAGRF